MAPPQRVAGTATLVLALALGAVACQPAPRDLVLVTFDTIRLDHVGVYAAGAGPSPTPRLDAVARGARVFERAYTPMPTTAPAHASLLTGLHPHEHGIERNGDRPPPKLTPHTLQRRLAEAGYATGAFVTSGVFGDALGLGGFDRWDAPEEPLRPGTEAAEAALSWLDEAPRPAFLWLHLYDPHAPYGAAQGKVERLPIDPALYGWVDRASYEDPAARARMASLYADGVRDADRALGLLLDGLAQRGRAPLLVITADHGELFDYRLASTGFAYGHGSLLTDEVLRIPLLIAGEDVAAGRVATPVSLRDLYTTLLAAAGLPDPAAAGSGRYDLRGALPERRIVLAARRVFRGGDRERKGIDPGSSEHVRAHAVAASDGERLVVLGEDGAPAPGSGEGEALRDAARTLLDEVRAAREAATPGTLDPTTRDRLEALGYLE